MVGKRAHATCRVYMPPYSRHFNFAVQGGSPISRDARGLVVLVLGLLLIPGLRLALRETININYKPLVISNKYLVKYLVLERVFAPIPGLGLLSIIIFCAPQGKLIHRQLKAEAARVKGFVPHLLSPVLGLRY